VALCEADVRRLALALSDVVEADHHGAPSFRIRGRIFCTVRAEPARLMVKLDPEDQHNLCAAHEASMAPVPGYWGTKGATFVDLSQVDEAFADMLLRLALATASSTAPRRRRRMAGRP